MSSWAERLAARNEATRAQGRWRTIRALDTGTPATTLSATGQRVVSFASNDYLGLSQHPAVRAAARSAIDQYGAGSGAARLIVGARPAHAELEDELARWCGREAALLFPTGYQANLGLLGALAATADDTVIYSDELNHASIIDGCRLSRASTVVFGHRDVAHLAALMAERPAAPSIVVTDAVFSMDGDVAPLIELAELCDQRGALLVADEAHAVLGGPLPAGTVVVGTLSKTLGVVGGFVAGSRDLIDRLVNSARSFIFTTAGTPSDAAATLAALGVLRSAEGDELIARLRANVDSLAPGHPSPILPVHLGSEQRAVQVADALLERGLLVPAIRPPTVAPGTCRLRVALSAAHTDEQITALRNALDEMEVHW